MSLFPEIQRKAQAELDIVVGPDRLPDFGDRESLVYLDAVIKEALRWMPSAPLGLTHCTRQDEVINGYYIPAGTVLLANIWYVKVSACSTRELIDMVIVQRANGTGHAYTTRPCTNTQRHSALSDFSEMGSPTQARRTQARSRSASVGGEFCFDY